MFLGKPLPKPLSALSMVSLGNKIIAIGGTDGSKYSQSLFELTCESEFTCEWTEMTQTLAIGRSSFVALPFDDNGLSNCT